MKSSGMKTRINSMWVSATRTTLLLAGVLAVSQITTLTAGPSGAIYTTNKGATIVNGNTNYASAGDVYLSGGPQNLNASGLTDGKYYFQVTDPSGKTLLSTDNAVCRTMQVTGGRVVGIPSGAPACSHAVGTFNPANGATPVQLAPYSVTPNNGGVYKAWAIPVGSATISGTDAKVLVFSNSNSKTDNFKVPPADIIPQGSCQPSSSLSVMVQGTNVTSYVPKGSWQPGPTGISVVNIEGASIVPTLIPTGVEEINSCASNPVTGVTVCTSNGNQVFLLSGTAVSGAPLTSASNGFIGFSGGFCHDCGVAMDAVSNRAVITMSLSGGAVGGFQFLDLATNTFGTPFTSASSKITENPVLDPIGKRLLSAAENNIFEIIDVSAISSPTLLPSAASHYLNTVTIGGELDSSAADCKLGLVLAPGEFTSPSGVFIADVSNPTFAPFAAGTWSAPSQVQVLSESVLAAGASGIAIAQETAAGGLGDMGVVSGEFGGDAITAIVLPTTSGTGAVPAMTDWVTCSIGNGFSNGFDPHTLTAYKSPNSGDAIALLANAGASTVAVVDLKKMLDTTIVPRTVGGHACTAGTLPASVVSFVAVP